MKTVEAVECCICKKLHRETSKTYVIVTADIRNKYSKEFVETDAIFCKKCLVEKLADIFSVVNNPFEA